MKYVSTRGEAQELDFEDVMLTGLARDGGLYLPKEWPKFTDKDLSNMAGSSYEEIAFTVMKPFIGSTFSDEEFKKIIKNAYHNFETEVRCPLLRLSDNTFLLELYYGPTLAFKDVAMQLIGQMFELSFNRQPPTIVIVGATSGDTGSAAIEAFRGLEAVKVFIMYPDGAVSDVQRRQMTTAVEKNVTALAVDGNFDDCQALLKEMFNDFEFRDEINLASVNSINWARVMAQVVYYFTSALALGAPRNKINFTVPTGNFGDIFAGYVAKKMGLPIDKLIIATNQNDILDRVIKTGIYKIEDVKPSISPSMDIQVSSNFERALFDIFDNDPVLVRRLMNNLQSAKEFKLNSSEIKKLQDIFESGSSSEEETNTTMRAVYKESGIVLCPHSATGVKIALENNNDKDTPMVVLATADPAKFPDAVANACGIKPELPDRMKDLFERTEMFQKVPNDISHIKEAITKGVNE